MFALFKDRTANEAPPVRRASVVRPKAAAPGVSATVALANASEPAALAAANEQIPIEEKPVTAVVLSFHEDIETNPDAFSIAWDAMALIAESERSNWLRSHAVLLKRKGRFNHILCFVSNARGSVLLQQFRNQVQKARHEIGQDIVVDADLLARIYRDFDRRGRAEVHGLSSIGANTTIHDNLLSELIRAAIRVDASDIHFYIRNDGGEKLGEICFRVDAELEPWKKLDPLQAMELVAALYAKADSKSIVSGQGQFNIDRSFSAFIKLKDERNAELRFQSHPERYGVDVVCRILGYDGKKLITKDLAGLGFLPSAIEIIEEVAYGPGGGVITVGETGSGKTTTINAILTGHPAVQSGQDYAMTVEDPPEGRPPNVSQFAVARSVESRAVGQESPFLPVLRATMRMDGDVISPGEIRDGDTAQIWLELALTGHKCFSSIHAASPRGAIERLCGKMMGLSADAISGEHIVGAAVFQKRIPKLCPHCRIPAAGAWNNGRNARKLSALVDKGMDVESLFVRNEKGCKHCRGGKKGAIVIPEIFNPDLEQRLLIAKGQFAEAELSWRLTRGSVPFTEPEVQGKTCFEIGLYYASVGEVGVDTLDKSIQRILSHTVVEASKK